MPCPYSIHYRFSGASPSPSRASYMPCPYPVLLPFAAAYFTATSTHISVSPPMMLAWMR